MSYFDSDEQIDFPKNRQKNSYDSHFTPLQRVTIQEKLNIPLLKNEVRTKPGQGNHVYIEGWRVFDKANEIFGFDGWRSSINLEQIYVEERNKRFCVAYRCTARVTLKNGAYHEDVGFGSSENFSCKGQALEKASKEAVTDAIKRALRLFGAALGNCLYDIEFNRNLLKPIPKLQRTNSTNHIFTPMSKGFTPLSNCPIRPISACQPTKSAAFDSLLPTPQPQGLTSINGTLNNSLLLRALEGSALDSEYANCNADNKSSSKSGPVEALKFKPPSNPHISISNPYISENSGVLDLNCLSGASNKFKYEQYQGSLVQAGIKPEQAPSNFTSSVPCSSRAANIATEELDNSLDNITTLKPELPHPPYIGQQTPFNILPSFIPTSVAFSKQLPSQVARSNNVLSAQYGQTDSAEIFSAAKHL